MDRIFSNLFTFSIYIKREGRRGGGRKEKEKVRESKNYREYNIHILYIYISSVCRFCLLPSSFLAKNEPCTALPVHAQYDDAIRAWVILWLQNFFHDPLDLGSFTYLAVDGGHEFHHVDAVNRLLFLEKPHRVLRRKGGVWIFCTRFENICYLRNSFYFWRKEIRNHFKIKLSNLLVNFENLIFRWREHSLLEIFKSISI